MQILLDRSWGSNLDMDMDMDMDVAKSNQIKARPFEPELAPGHTVIEFEPELNGAELKES
jgi:hypothetical protein